MKTHYDVIVVGARAAGAATAMLLARRGLRVLVVDRARYGSDTLSTHALMRPALLQLERWGLLDTVHNSGAPAVRRAVFHYPDERVALDIEPLYAPRRTVLDAILADAAMAAGAHVRFGVAVNELLEDSSGRVIGISADGLSARASIVVGADGIRSVVAADTKAPMTRIANAGGACVFAYFQGVQAEGYEWIYGDRVAAGLIPTNGGEVCVFVGGPEFRFRREVQPDLERGFARILEEASPAVAARVASGVRTTRFRGFAGVRGYYRKPFGPGWALVGDAGYFRDPITTHGISDAFRDAELLVRAIDGTSTFQDYEQIRNDVSRDMFAVTERIAGYDWTLPEVRTHLRHVSAAMKAETKLLLSFDRKETVACSA
jgi:flavin-dependent dehydrogenase